MKFTELLKGVLLAACLLPLALMAQAETAEPIRATDYKTGVPGERESRTEQNIKFEEIFDTTILPVGWQIIDNDGSGTAIDFRQEVNFISGDSVRAEAGQSFFYSNFNNANSNGLIDEYIITPRLPVVEAGDSLIFYAGAIDGGFDDSLRVWVSTTDSLLGSFTDQIAYFKVDGPVGGWNRYAFDMSAYAGEEPYVAVNYYIVEGGPTGTHSDNVWIDHFIHKAAASPTARVQVIHNAADPAAAVVDVYLNGTELLPDFAFRDASPFIDAPAGVPLNIGIAPGNSGGVGDTLVNFAATLTAGETYVVTANGVLDPASFAPNPDGRNTGFGLFINAAGQEASSDPNTVEFSALHGATDAPTVDVDARGVATLVDDAAYGDITGYLGVPPAEYILDVKDGSGAVTVASFAADLSGLTGGAATVFASGFLDPSANQNGPGFGLFAALPNGDVVEFPAITTARVQVVHNAADPAAAVVDVYLDGTELLPDFAFRDATAFIDAPAGTPINIGVAPGNSGGVADTLVNFVATLTPGETYVVIANGVLDPSGFAPNPNGRNTGFGLFINAAGQEASSDPATVEFSALHGSSDAPTVDVIARNVATLVDDATYGDITGYISVPPASYTLDVTDASGSTVVASFAADLSSLAGGAAQVFASGFLDPSANQNGPAFGLFAALPNGDVVEFSPVVGIEDDLLDGTINNFELEQNYPNPFNPTTTIRYAIPQNSDVSINIYNIAGQKVATLVNERKNTGAYTVEFDASRLPSGVYFYQINAGEYISARKMVLSK